MTGRIPLLGFLAVLVCALLIIPAHSRADAQRIVTREDFIRALEVNTVQGLTEYELAVDRAMYADIKNGMDGWVSEARANCGMRSFSYSYSERTGILKLTNIEYRVAVRILQAYSHGDLSWLTDRERKTLDRAIGIVRSAPVEQLAREQYIHDVLCASVIYYTNDNQYEEKDQAIGALLNGKADCDGYSEAFYLLCNLANIPARFQHGDTYKKTDNSDATHMWNLVCVYDTWMMVDVTWDDSDKAVGNFYLYYNIGSERAAETHIWDASVLAVPWSAKTSNTLRPAEVVEGYANSMIAAEKYIRETLINTHPYRVALKYANDIEIDNNNELLAKWVYSTGVKEFVWKSGGHCLEILATEWYDEYRIVASDQEALAYVNEMKAAGKQAYHIFFAGEYGRKLFANDLTGYYNLEGQFGFEKDEMYYSLDAQRVSFSNIIYDRQFRVCRTETDVLNYIDELKRKRISSFTLCIPGEYGESLLSSQLARYHLLEAQFGFENDEMTYYSKTHRFIYKNVKFADHFRVCGSQTEIISFIDSAAGYGYSDLQLHVPGKYGASLFANKASLLSSIIDATLLKNGYNMTYSQNSQTCYIKNAQYWTKKNRVPLNSMDAYMRKLLANQPKTIAVWNDGTYKWNESLIKELGLSVYRQGVENFRYYTSPEKIEFVTLNYASNYRLVETEDEVLSYLRECRSRSQSSFAIYCSKSLYEKLSANSFDRFFSITKSILKQGQSINYSGSSYMISMKNVNYK